MPAFPFGRRRRSNAESASRSRIQRGNQVVFRLGTRRRHRCCRAYAWKRLKLDPLARPLARVREHLTTRCLHLARPSQSDRGLALPYSSSLASLNHNHCECIRRRPLLRVLLNSTASMRTGVYSDACRDRRRSLLNQAPWTALDRHVDTNQCAVVKVWNIERVWSLELPIVHDSLLVGRKCLARCTNSTVWQRVWIFGVSPGSHV